MSIIIKSGSSGNLANVDSLGNIAVLSTPAAMSSTAAPWTSATLSNTAQILASTGGYPAVLLQLNQTSTITGGVVTYEGTFDGINWVALPASFCFDPLTLATSPNPYTLQPNTNQAVLLQTGGFQQIRVRLSTAISGTGSVTLYWTAQSLSPLASSGSTTIVGTLAANVIQVGGSAISLGQTTMSASIPVVIASDQSAIPVTVPGSIPVTQSTSPWVVSGTVTANIGTTGGLALDATLTGGTQVTKLVDAGGVNEAAISATGVLSVDGSSVIQPVSGTVTANQGTSPWVVSLTSTTVTGTVAVTQSTSPWVVSNGGTFAVQAAQSGTWTVQQGSAPWSQVGTLTHNNAAPAANNVGVLPAVASSAAPTFTTGDQVLLSTDLSGNLRVAGSLTVSDVDTVGTPVALNAGGVTATVATTGQGGVGVLIAAGTLAATVVAEISYDGGTTWVASVFFDPTANTTSATLVFTNPNAATQRTILIDGGVSNARVRVSAFTSGTATATLRSTFNAGGQYVNQGGAWSVSVPGTVAVTQSTSPWVVSLTSTTITGTVAVTQSTSPWVISGTVTANAGTGNFTVVQGTAASLNATVVGTGTFAVQASQVGGPWTQNLTQVAGTALGATAVTNFGSAPAAAAVMGVNASIYAGTTGISATSSSLNVNVTNTVPVTLTSTTITGTVAVTQSTTPWTIQGDSASGAANAGNPVKTGGVFNTTQPTVTNGQTVDSQSTARGATIVATGVDTFNVTASGTVAVSSVGGTVAVTQSTSPWVVSLTSTTITGTVAVTQSGTWTVQQGGAPWSQNLTEVAGTTLGATAVTNFGSAPAAAAVPGVNASLFSGTTALTNTGGALNANITNTVPVTLTSTTITGTVAVTQSTSPWVVNMSQWGGTALGTPTAFGTTPGAVVVGAANVSLFQGTAVISNSNPTFASITDGTTKVTVIAATAALKSDLSSVAGTATVTAAAGVAKVGIVGNTAATLDSANTAATAPTNALLTSAMYNSTVPALTTGQAVAAECDTAGSLYQNAEGRKQTYRVGVIAFTPIASGTSPAISVTGSATKTIRISRIRISITAGTGTACDISLQKFTALSGGTANSQAANVAKMDSGNVAQTAVVNQWSAAATTHTAAGILNAERYEIVTAAVSVLPGVIEWTFGDKNGQALVLRGTSEFCGILISAVGTTPLADCWVEWTEE